MSYSIVKPVTLYSGPLSMFGAKCQIAASEKGLPVHVVMVPFTEDHRYEPKHSEVLRVNPKGQVPVLIHGDVEIFDSTQIMEYFEDLRPEPSLWPRSRALRAKARLLELKSDEVFFPKVIRLMDLQSCLAEPPAQVAISALHHYYGEMDSVLNQHEHFCDEFGNADIAFFMAQLFASRLGASMDLRTPYLLAWRERVARRTAVRAVIRQIAASLTQQGRAVPPFMLEAGALSNG